MSREQQLRTIRAVSLNRAIDEQASTGMFPWQPNWVDYRSSVANVDRRADRDDTARTCEACGCEVDITPAPHSPKCKLTAAQAEAAAAAALLCVEDDCDEPVASKHGKHCPAHAAERQEAGRRRYNRSSGPSTNGHAEVLGEAAAPGNGEGRAASSSTETGSSEVGGVSSPGRDTPRRGDAKVPGQPRGEAERRSVGGASTSKRYVKWTPELAKQRVRDLALELGRPPSSREAAKHGLASLQTTQTLRRLGFDTWRELRAAALSEREPQAETATAFGRAAQSAARTPRRSGATTAPATAAPSCSRKRCDRSSPTAPAAANASTSSATSPTVCASRSHAASRPRPSWLSTHSPGSTNERPVQTRERCPVRVRCNLRALREQMPRKSDGEKISLRDIEQVAHVSAGVLSQIERGVMLPPDRQVEQLEAAYGVPIEDWYDKYVLRVLQADEEAD